jgi:prepilin-type N-terminal cleavage/methylation domain-containing protein
MTKSKQAFTLIEMLITLAIISILTAVGVPIYQDYVISSIENQAKVNLQSIAFMQGDHRRESGQYLPCPKKTLGTTQIDKQFFGGQGDLSSSDYSYKMIGGCSDFIASALIFNSKAKCFKIDQNRIISSIACPKDVSLAVAKGSIKEVDDWECVSSFGGPGTLVDSPGNMLHGSCLVVVQYNNGILWGPSNYVSIKLPDGTVGVRNTMFRTKHLYRYTGRAKTTISYQRAVAWHKYIKSKDGRAMVVADYRNIFDPKGLYNAITNKGNVYELDQMLTDDGKNTHSGSPIGTDSYKSLKGTFSEYNTMSQKEKITQLCKARPGDEHCP